MLVLLIVEALCVQLACTLYNWYLIRAVEKGRVPHFLIMLGLPGPILRQMVAAHCKVGVGWGAHCKVCVWWRLTPPLRSLMTAMMSRMPPHTHTPPTPSDPG